MTRKRKMASRATTTAAQLLVDLTKAAQEGRGSGVLTRPTQDDGNRSKVKVRPVPSQSLNQPRNAAEDRQNRAGGGAAGTDAIIDAANAIETSVARLVESLRREPSREGSPETDNQPIQTDFRKHHHPLDQTRNVPRNLDEIEHYVAAKRVVEKQLDYAAGQDLDNLSSALGISPGNQRHAARIEKSGWQVPSDSYESAGDIRERIQKGLRDEKQRQLFEPDPDAPLPWHLRRR